MQINLHAKSNYPNSYFFLGYGVDGQTDRQSTGSPTPNATGLRGVGNNYVIQIQQNLFSDISDNYYTSSFDVVDGAIA